MTIAKTERRRPGRMLGRAIEAGVNSIDTADVYADGQSETMRGR